jgi:hypothetical protein
MHLAAQTGRSKAYYLRELETKGLEDLKDYYLAAAAMERVRKGEERPWLGRVVFLVWTPRGDDSAHLISCHYANRTQVEAYFSAL